MGIVSSIFGGTLGDKLGAKNPSAYSKIAMGASALAMPMMCISTLFLNNFPLAVFATLLTFLFGEASWGNAITMI
jgi:hypothetical protein